MDFYSGKELLQKCQEKQFPISEIMRLREITTGSMAPEKLEKKLEKEGIAVAGRAHVGPTIGSHVGPEAYGVIFVRKKKLEVKIFE